MIKVLPIKTEETEPWLLKKHYARRMCPISYAFGAYYGSKLIGVVTYGTPVSSSLRVGVCGEKWMDNVIELNRLCCENKKNIASILVGRSLKMLPKPTVVVSYADTEQGHVGYVYQATNFVYTGLSAKRTDWKLKGMEHLHGATVSDMSRGQENRAQWMRDKFGDDFYLQDRARKHRYVYFVGSQGQKKAMLSALMYDIEPYPKGDSKRYDAGGEVSTQELLFV
jgi:hypothetical protein